MYKFEIIVFDMDGTLYDISDVVKMNYMIQCDFIKQEMHLDNKHVTALFEQNHIYPVMKRDSKSCTEFFERIGLSRSKWNKYREEHFSVESISLSGAAPYEIMLKFADKCQLILLTSNSFNNTKNILEHIKIDNSIFSEIICSDHNQLKGSFNKKRVFKYIIDNYSIEFSRILSIGDRIETDIKPCIDLGGHGVQIKTPDSLKRVLADLSNNHLSTCRDYIFF